MIYCVKYTKQYEFRIASIFISFRMSEKTWINEIIESPLNIALLMASGYLIYKILSDVFHVEEPYVPPPKLVKDMTLKKRLQAFRIYSSNGQILYNSLLIITSSLAQELRKYNGKDMEKVCLAVKGEIFDVTRGKNFYGPGGPYDVFAGRDCSRAFASFSTDDEMFKDERDDLSDLDASQKSQLDDWYMNISSKYDFVGKLLFEV